MKAKKILLKIAAILFWIAAWHIGASAANKNMLIAIPLPLQTLEAFWRNIGRADFLSAVGRSLLHIAAGFICAAVLGLALGMAAGANRAFYTLISPITHLIRSVPVAAFIILAWLWIPSGILPSFISFLTVFPIVWLQVMAGTAGIDKKLTEVPRVMRVSRFKVFFGIKLPMTMPYFRTSCITGLGFAWKSGVAAEVICNPTGTIGSMLSRAKQTIDYPQVFAVTLTIVLLSLLLENIIKLLWREKRYD